MTSCLNPINLPDGFTRKEATPRPLDAIAGITDAPCATSDGPIVKTYVQRHPTDPNRLVGVVTFENYFSNEWLQVLRIRTNNANAAFKRNQGGSYIRVATHLSEEKKILAENHSIVGEILYRPGLVFGANAKLHEATADIKDHETALLKMTTIAHQLWIQSMGSA